MNVVNKIKIYIEIKIFLNRAILTVASYKGNPCIYMTSSVSWESILKVTGGASTWQLFLPFQCQILYGENCTLVCARIGKSFALSGFPRDRMCILP